MSVRRASALAVLVLAAALGVRLWGARPEVLHRALADTLNATKTRDSVFVVAKLDSGTRDLTESRAAMAAARATRATTDSIRRVADSLLAGAVQRDSDATAWKLTALTYRQVADSLVIVADSLTVAQATAERAAVGFRLAIDTLTRRNHQLEALKVGYEKDMRGMEKRCRVGPVPCPNRTVVGAALFLLGAFAK